MSNFRFIIILLLTFVLHSAKSQTLIMNEVSNGPAGNQEYVEFVVVSSAVTYTCTNLTPPCIDIRGWIFDDNSGFHGASGVAAGAVRFSQNPIWACIPLGTIILIYNNGDRNPAIPPDDLSMADGNCTIIAPLNSVLFESNVTTPGAVACSYPATGWTSGGNWNNTLLANVGDCARIVDLSGCEVFSMCWGTDNLNNLIYFSGSGAQKVWYFNDVDPSLQVNWSSGSASPSPGNQTPGAPNNPLNAAYIAQFNNGCMPITQTSVTATSVNAGCSCTGSASASASGSIGGYTYAWFDASMNPIGQTNATATGLCSGIYYVTATSHIGCSATTSVNITSSGSTTVAINSETICAGNTAVLTATPSAVGGTFLWSPGGETSSSISVNPASSTTYSLSYSLPGCVVNKTVTLTVNPLPTVSANSSSICAGQTSTLVATGATSYTWNTGAITPSILSLPLSNTSYTVIGATLGCTNTAVATITVVPQPSITINSPIICGGETATLSAAGATSYTWNTGATFSSITVSPSSNTNYTVLGTAQGCTNTAVSSVSVNPLPLITINSPTICAGETATLSATGATTYSWSNGATSATISESPSITTNYTLTGIDLGCSNTTTVSLYVNPLPIITVNSMSLCAGQTGTLYANGATSYAWNTGAITSSILVLPTTSATYTVVGTLLGCTNTAVSIVSVTPLPSVSVSSATICSGQTATLTASGATTFTWSNGSNNSSLLDSPTSNTNYTVTGEQSGCVNSATANIVINPSLLLSVNAPTICAGQTTTLTSLGATSFTWSDGSTGNNIIVSPLTTTSYSVSGDNGACSGSVIATVVVNALPVVTVNSSTICAGQTATIIANGATSYSWNTGTLVNTIIDAPLISSSYTVTGTQGGCSNTAVSIVSVTPLPSVSVSSATICSGQTATLTASGATTFTWSNGSNNSSLLDSPTSNTNYTVTGEQSGCVNSATANIVINPSLLLSVNAPTICAGQTTTLTSLGATSFTWSDGSTGNNIIVSPLTTTSYSVSGDNGVCSGSVIATVVVNALPVVTVNTSTICAGQSINLVANGAASYVWNTGAVSSSISVSPNITTNYSVTGTTNNCSSMETTTVTVNLIPVLSVNNSTICNGQSTVLNASGATSYLWNTGATTNTISVNPVATTSYTLVGTSLGCSSSAITSVVVNSVPNVTASSATICAGKTATLSASGASNYVWSNGHIGNPLIVSPTISTTYTVIGSINSCTNMSVASVNVFDAPMVNFNSSVILGCAPLCVDFTDLSTVTTGSITNWNWSFGNGDQSSIQSPRYCFDDPGFYNITLTAESSNGCSTTLIKNNMINVFTVPVAEFTTNLQETDVLDPFIQFNNLSTNAVSYHWIFGDLSTSNQTNPSHVFGQEGIYTTTLVATSANGCKDIVLHDIKVNGIFTFYAPNTFTPNDDGINDVFFPMGTGWDPNEYKLNIHDRWGNMCFSTEDVHVGWDGRANNGNEPAQIDTYTWKVELMDMFGQKHKYIGRVSIIK